MINQKFLKELREKKNKYIKESKNKELLILPQAKMLSILIELIFLRLISLESTSLRSASFRFRKFEKKITK